MTNNYICFDLEGPLSTQDNAYELMKLFPQGGRVFENISRYDDLLALEGKPGYEPGDTLALIVPFLVYHGITEEHVLELARQARLVGGAADLTAWLSAGGWQVFCVSTSYEQYAHYITGKLGIPAANVACTAFPLNQFRAIIKPEETALLRRIEKGVLECRPGADDAGLKAMLDDFFWRVLPGTSLGQAITRVKPVGGNRKVAALSRFAEARRQPLAGWVAVGDSITDIRMLGAVRDAGGLSIAFNANEFPLPYAVVGLASTHISDLQGVLGVWREGGRKEVARFVSHQTGMDSRNRGNFQWLLGESELDGILQVHKRVRRLVREEAARLG